MSETVSIKGFGPMFKGLNTCAGATECKDCGFRSELSVADGAPAPGIPGRRDQERHRSHQERVETWR